MSKVKVTLFTVFLAMLITAIFLLDEYKNKNNVFTELITEKKFIIHNIMNQNSKFQNIVFETLVTNYVLHENLSDAIIKDDQQTINRKLEILFAKLKQTNMYVDKLTFINQKGIGTFRAHTSENSQVNLIVSRSLVEKAFNSQKFTSGFERGIYGVSYRMIVPIIYQNKVIALIDTGLSPKYFTDKIASILKGTVVDIVIVANKDSKHFLKSNLYYKEGFYYHHHEFEPFLAMLKNNDEVDMQHDDRYFHVIKNLGKGLLSSDDLMFSGAFDITSLKNDFNYFIIKAIVAFLIGGVLLYYVVFKSLDYYEKQLQENSKQLALLNETLQKRIEEEVENNIKKDKLLVSQGRSAAMGDMIANIAHQWRQPIASISMIMQNIIFDLDYIKHKEISRDELSNELKKCTKILAEMSQIIDVFRDFFRPKSFQKFKFQESINDVVRLIESIFLTYGVKIEVNVKTEDLYVWGLPNEINQVIINIVNNAKDAIESNDPYLRTIFIELYQEDGFGVCKIKDLAGGIPEDAIEHIFEPYFTTKNDKQGTGIGLDMCKTIIEKSNGKIYAYNYTQKLDEQEMKGACFEVYLPLECEIL